VKQPSEHLNLDTHSSTEVSLYKYNQPLLRRCLIRPTFESSRDYVGDIFEATREEFILNYMAAMKGVETIVLQHMAPLSSLKPCTE